MKYLIDGKKYDDKSSELLYRRGTPGALFAENALVSIYKSTKGTVWARMTYWVSDARMVETLVAGEDAVRKLIDQYFPYNIKCTALEAVFGEVEEG